MSKIKSRAAKRAGGLGAALGIVYMVMNAVAKLTDKDAELYGEKGGRPRNTKGTLYSDKLKPRIDKQLAFLGMVVLAPVYLLVSAAIRLEDPGAVIFTQKRVGNGKSHFTLHKFRSMKLSTPHDTPTHLLADPDQYLLKSGKLIRKLSIDELPQLWDIFRGKMSVIGPRPALWNQYDLIEERDKYGANDIMPGLTGWAQINGRDELEIPVKARLDGDYAEALKKNSVSGFMMDCKCFFGTVRSVLRSEGVVEGGTGELRKKEQECGSGTV